ALDRPNACPARRAHSLRRMTAVLCPLSGPRLPFLSRFQELPWLAMFTRTVTFLRFGTVSLSNSRRFGMASMSWEATPVVFPPGLARLLTLSTCASAARGAPNIPHHRAEEATWVHYSMT